jgi:hypothetical protein
MLNGVPVAGVAGAGTSSAVAVTTVYVLTSGSGDSYRIERVYLDSDQAYRFAQDYYNGMPRWYRSRWRNGRSVPRAAPRTALTGDAEWWAPRPCQQPSRRAGHTRDGERREKLESANKVDRGRPAEHQGGVSQTHRVPKAAGGGPVKRETTHGNLGYTIVTFRAELARV